MSLAKKEDAEKVWMGNSKLVPLLVPIEPLVLDPTNARDHNDRNINAIMYSLATYGQQKNISLDKEGRVALAGNGTVMAARALGWTHIAAVPFESDDPVTVGGWKIADNRTAELATWNFEHLAEGLRNLQDAGADLTKFGWEPFELEPLLTAEWRPPDEGPLPTGGHQSGKSIVVTEGQRERIERAVGEFIRQHEPNDREVGAVVALICDVWYDRNRVPEQEGAEEF